MWLELYSSGVTWPSEPRKKQLAAGLHDLQSRGRNSEYQAWKFLSVSPGLILYHYKDLNELSVCARHYIDVTMTTMASQITSLTIVYSIVYSGTDQRKHQSSASLAFVRGIHWGPVNSPHKGPVTRKMFPFDDVITIPRTIVKCGEQRSI